MRHFNIAEMFHFNIHVMELFFEQCLVFSENLI